MRMYNVVGTDGKVYGPAAADQIRRWIAEGRIESRTPIFADGAKDWTFAGLLPEFAAQFGVRPQIIAPPPPAGPMPGQIPRTNSWATAGLIFGILSWICCGPFGLLGIIFSLIALSQINANPQTQQGRGLAIAGLILSALNLLLILGWLLFSLAFHPPTVTWHYSHF